MNQIGIFCYSSVAYADTDLRAVIDLSILIARAVVRMKYLSQ